MSAHHSATASSSRYGGEKVAAPSTASPAADPTWATAGRRARADLSRQDLGRDALPGITVAALALPAAIAYAELSGCNYADIHGPPRPNVGTMTA